MCFFFNWIIRLIYFLQSNIFLREEGQSIRVMTLPARSVRYIVLLVLEGAYEWTATWIYMLIIRTCGKLTPFCFFTQCCCVSEAIVIVAAFLSHIIFPCLPSPPPSLIPPFTTPSPSCLIRLLSFPNSQSDFTHRLIAVYCSKETCTRLVWFEWCRNRYISIVPCYKVMWWRCLFPYMWVFEYLQIFLCLQL
jgi:hypothetical protein